MSRSAWHLWSPDWCHPYLWCSTRRALYKPSFEEYPTSPRIPPTQRARLRGTSWTQWRWRAHTRERSHQRAKTCPVERSHQRSTWWWEHRHCVFIGKGPNWQWAGSATKNTLLDVPSARKRSMRLLRVDRASAPDQKDRSQGWVQSPLHNQGRNECLQDPKKMPAMPQDHLWREDCAWRGQGFREDIAECTYAPPSGLGSLTHEPVIERYRLSADKANDELVIKSCWPGILRQQDLLASKRR